MPFYSRIVNPILRMILHSSKGIPCDSRVRTGLKITLEGFLEKSLKIKSALKSTGKSLKGLEVFYFL